jgi:hypothetical protein
LGDPCARAGSSNARMQEMANRIVKLRIFLLATLAVMINLLYNIFFPLTIAFLPYNYRSQSLIPKL